MVAQQGVGVLVAIEMSRASSMPLIRTSAMSTEEFVSLWNQTQVVLRPVPRGSVARARIRCPLDRKGALALRAHNSGGAVDVSDVFRTAAGPHWAGGLPTHRETQANALPVRRLPANAFSPFRRCARTAPAPPPQTERLVPRRLSVSV